MKLLLVLLLYGTPLSIFAQADEVKELKRNEMVLNLITTEQIHIGKTPFFILEVRYSRYFLPAIAWRVALSYRNYEGRSNGLLEDDDVVEYGIKAGLRFLSPK